MNVPWRRALIVVLVLVVATWFSLGGIAAPGGVGTDSTASALQNGPKETFSTCDKDAGNRTLEITEPGVYKLADGFTVGKEANPCISIEVSNVTLLGNGQTLNPTEGGADDPIRAIFVHNSSDIDNVTIKNLTIDGSETEGGDKLWDYGIKVGAGTGAVTDVTLRNVTVRNVLTSSLEFVDTDDSLVVNSSFTNGGRENQAPSVALLQNSEGNELKNVEVSNQNTAGEGLRIASGSSGNAVLNSTVTGNSGGGILVGAIDTRVEGSNVSDNSGPGLRFTGRNATVRDTKVQENSVDGVTVNGRNATVRNINARNNGGSGIVVNANGATIRDSDFVDNSETGIQVSGGNVSVDDATVKRNAVDRGAGAIDVTEGGDGVTIRNSHVENNDAGDGISVKGRNATLVNNTVLGAATHGVHVEYPELTVVGNDVRNSGSDGIRISDASGTASTPTVERVEDNFVKNSGEVGIRFTSTELSYRVVNNTVVDTTNQAGIHVGSSKNVFLDNTVRNNPVGIRLGGGLSGDNSDNLFRNTKFRNNGQWSVVARNGVTNATFESPDLGYANADLNFSLADARLTPTDDPGSLSPSRPRDQTDIDVYLDVERTAQSAYFDVTVEYDASVEPEIQEPTISLWRYNGSWTELTDTTVDTTNNVLGNNFTAAEIETGTVVGPFAEPNRTVADCRTIRTGGVYEVDRDITASGLGPNQACIEVLASDVIVDGNGFALDGSGAGTGVLVNESAANVTVRDLTVEEFETGVQFGKLTDYGVDTGNVTEVTVRNNAQDGVVVYESTGIVVENVTATGNDRDGIRIGANATNEVRNSTVDASGGRYGIAVYRSDDNVLSNNTVENGRTGISLYSGSTGNVLSDNTVRGSTEAGIELDNGDQTTVNDTTVRNAGIGINVTGDARNNDFDDVAVLGSGQWAVVVTDSGSNNRFDRLDLGFANGNISATPQDLRLRRDASPPANPSTEEDIGIYLNVSEFGSSTALDLTVNYNASVEDSIDESTFAIWKNDGSWSELSGSVDTNANTVSASGIGVSGNATLAPLATRTLSSCRVVDDPGGYVLTGSITNNSTTTCIRIAASNVTIEGNGYTIDGENGTPDSTAVVVAGGVQGVNVSNVILEGFETGVAVESGVTDSTVDEVVVPESNVHVIDGISLKDTTGVTVKDSRVANVSRAVEVIGGSGTTLRRNELSASSVGLYAQNAGDTDARNTTLTGNRIAVDISGSSGTTASFDNTTFRDSTEWAVTASGGIRGSFANPDLSLPNGTVSFDLTDGKLRKTDSAAEPDTPGTEGDIGQFLNATGTSTSARLDLTVEYDYDFNGSTLIEKSLAAWSFFNGTWTERGGTLDAGGDTLTVSLNASQFGSDGDAGRLVAPLAADQRIDDCGVIDDPGEYRLVADIQDDGTRTCIEITASNVVLNGGYHRVDGLDAGTPGGETQGIAVTTGPSSVQNVTVRNVVVTGFDTGVDVGDDSSALAVTNATVANVLVPGTAASPDARGLVVANATGATVRNVTVSNSSVGVAVFDSGGQFSEVSVDGSGRGIDVSANGNPVVVNDTEVNDSDQFGIRLTGVASPVLNNVTAYRNGGAGVDVRVSTGNASLTDVDVGGNGGTGVFLATGDEGFELQNVASSASGGNGVEVTSTAGGGSLTDVVVTDATQQGVRVDSGSGSVSLTDVSVDGSGDGTGVLVTSGTGDVTLTNVDSANNTAGYGVRVDSAAGTGSLADVSADDNGDTGIYVTTGGGSATVGNVTAANNTGGGVLLDAEGGTVTLDNVTVRDNAGIGLEVGGAATDSSLTDVTARRNDGEGLFVGPESDGIEVTTATFENNTVGVRIAQAADGTRFASAVFANNSRWALNASSTGNEFDDPVLGLENGTVEFTATAVRLRAANVSAVPAAPGTDGDIGLFLNASPVASASESPALDLRIDYAFDFGNSDLLERSLAVWRNDGAWDELGGTVNTSSDTLNVTLNGFPSPDAYFGPLAANGTISDCGVIDDPGRYEVVDDIRANGTSACLKITASDVSLDGNFHLIDGVDPTDPSGETKGIVVTNASESLENVTVTNVTVAGFDTAVDVGNASTTTGVTGPTVANVLVPGTNASADSTGVLVSDSSGATVRNVTVSNYSDGVVLAGSGGELSNVAVDNATRGVDVSAGGLPVTVNDSEVNDSDQFGIRVAGADSPTLDNVTAYRNGGVGVEVTAQVGRSNLTDVAVGDNGATGVKVAPSGAFALSNVTATGDAGHGVRVSSGSGSGRLANVTVENSSQTGVSVTNDASVSLSRVSVSNATADGISVDSGVGGLALGDVSSTNNTGTGVVVTAGNYDLSLAEVTVNDNGGDGLSVSSTGMGSSLSNLTARRNDGTGLALATDAGDAVVSNATFENNTVGVTIADGASGNRFASATFANNSLWAVEAASANNEFDDPVLGLENGTVEFVATDVRLRAANVSAVPAPPGTDGDIGLFLNASPVSGSPSLDLRIDYAFDFENSDLLERSLAVWRNDGSWMELGGTVNTSSDTLNATVTDFSSPDAYFGPLAANSTVSGCGVIDDPGSYVLQDSIRDAAVETCLRITAPDVTLDGDGALLNGVNGSDAEDGPSRGVLVEGGLDNVTVTNLDVAGFRRGVQVGTGSATVTSVTVARVDVLNDSYDGTRTTAGIGLADTRNVTVLNGVLENVDRSLVLSSAVNTTVEDVTARDDTVGVFLTGSSDNSFNRTTFRNNSKWAIDAGSAGGQNEFANPDFDLPNGNVSFVLEDVKLRPVNESEAPNPRITEDDIGIYLNASGTGGASELNLTVNYDQSISEDVVEDTLSLWRYNRSNGEWTDLGGDLDNGTNTLRKAVTEFGVVAPLATNRTISNCGVIDRKGTWTLGSNVTNATADPCIRITADGATLDGDGHYIKGLNNTDGSRGVLVANDDSGRLTNVTVRDLGVSGWDRGLAVSTANASGVDNLTVTNVTAVDNTGVGVLVGDSGTVDVRDVLARNNGVGVSVRRGSDTVNVTDTVASGGSTGILVGGGVTALDVRNATVERSGTGLEVGATGVDVTNSTLRENADGIVVGDGVNSFVNNTLAANADGVVLEGSHNRFENTTFENNADWSIRSNLSGTASVASNNTFVRPRFGFENGTVNFTVTDLNVRPTPESERPSLSSFSVAKQDVDVYFDLANVSEAPSFDLTLQYERTDPATIEDETLKVWRYNGSWTALRGTVNETTDTLNATLGAADFEPNGTDPLVFAPLADPAAPDFRVTLEGTNGADGVVGGSVMSFNITVTNEGDLKGTQDIPVTLNDSSASKGEQVAVNDSVEIGPGKSVNFNLTWETIPDDDGVYNASVESENSTDSQVVEVLAPAKYVVNVTDTNSPIVENGSDLSVATTVRNEGDVNDSQSIVLRINGTPVDYQNGTTIPGGEARQLNFTWTPGDGQIGQFNASVGSENTADSRLVRVYDAQNFLVDIVDTNLEEIENTPNATVEGNLFNATVRVNNTGDVDATQTVRLLRNGSEITSESVTLSGDFQGDGPETETISLTWQTSEGDAGSYNISAVSGNDTDSQLTNVLDSQNFSVTITGTNSPDDRQKANVEGGQPVEVDVSVTNTGEVTGTQELNLTVPGPGPDAVVRDRVNVTLGPNETNDSITLVWVTERDGFGGDAGTYDDATVFSANDSSDTTVRVLDSPYFNVTVTSTNAPIVANETLEVDVEVTNTGEVSDRQAIDLTVPAGATQRANRTITLNASETKDLTLEWETERGDGQENQYGARVSSVNDSDETNVRVNRPAEVAVVDILSTNSPVLQNETLEIRANITNVGDIATIQNVALKTNGTVRDERTVNLAGGQTRIVTFTWETGPGDAGGYVADIVTENDTDSRDVTVLAPGATTIELDSSNPPVVEGETMSFNVTVENTGDTEETQLVALRIDGSIKDSEQVTLAGRESRQLTLTWETLPGDAGDYRANLTTANDSVRRDVRVDAPASFGVTINSTNSAIVESETLRVNATVRNLGDVAGNETVTLSVAGEQRDAREVRLGGDENRTVTLTWATGEGDGGSYEAVVAAGGGNDTTEVTVQRPADLEVSISSVDSTVVEGETMSVTATVRNVGDLSVTRSVVLSVGGQQRDSERVTIRGNDRVPVTLTWETGEGDAGNFTAEVTSGGVSDDREVGVLAPATYAIDVQSLSSTVTEGQRVGATLEISNVGDLAGNQTVTLSVGANQRDNVTVALEPGESVTRTLIWHTQSGDAGQYTLYASSLTDTESFNVTVQLPGGGGGGGGGGTPNQNPTVSITYNPGTPERGQGVRFEADAEDPDGSIEAYQWRINGEPASRAGSFSTTFESSGTYRVSVVVTDDDGANAETQTVVVVNSPPSVEITQAPSSIRLGDEATFSATGSDGDGTVASYTWEANGSVIGRGPSIDYAFTSPGRYRVSVVATDDDGESVTERTFVVVTENAPPEARIQQDPNDVGVGDTVTLSASTVDPDGEVVEYRWFVEDELVSTDESFERTFDEAGEFDVRLVVTDNEGAQDTVNRTLRVNDPPTASLDISNVTPQVNQSITLDATTTDRIGGVERIEWRIDGEVVSTSEEYEVSFDEPGEYDVTLVVVDENGASVSVNETIQVQAANVPERTAQGSGEVDFGTAGGNIVPILLVLGVLTLLVLYLYVRFRQLTGGPEDGDSGGE